MTREARQEIRRVLLGRTLIAEDGRLVAMEKGQLRVPLGVTDGAGAVRFLGIRKRACRLDVKLPKARALEQAFSHMQDLGRGLYLPQQPEAAACLIRYVLTRPAVLIFSYQDEVPVLTAWAGRGLTGWISNRRALHAFTKNLPKGMSVSERPVPEDPEEAKKKQEKLARKEAKKKKKQEKKLRRQQQKQKQQKAKQQKAAAASSQPEQNTEEKHE